MEQTKAAERTEKRRTWNRELESWKSSGLSQAEYCRRKGLKFHRFVYWRKRILSDQTGARLVEVPVRSSLSFSPPMAVVVNGRHRIELDRGFDMEAVERLVHILARL